MTNKYDKYDLFAHTDSHLTRTKIEAKRERRFYPSEGSVVVHDSHGDKVVYGGCMRASYFRLSGEFKGAPYNARTEFIFLQGKIIEKMLVEKWKEMGIWHANSTKFLDEENNISGELDAILVEPNGTLYGTEIKTFYGYNAKKEIFGNKWVVGKPKMSHLLQTLIYANYFKETLPYFRIAYFARDSVDRKTFKVELEQEGETLYPKVDGIIHREFSIQDIYNRYKELAKYVETKNIPPNDFELQYSDEKIEDFAVKGKIAKTKLKKWEDNKLGPYEYIGDWRCAYCSFKETCWGGGKNEC